VVLALFFSICEVFAAAFVDTFRCHDVLEIRVSTKFEKVFQLIIRRDDADHLTSRDSMTNDLTS